MKTVFGAHHGGGSVKDLSPGQQSRFNEYLKVSFVRDPVSRFFSSYEEMFVRTVPWGDGGHLPLKFKFLHEGMQSYKDYEAIFCPPHLRPKGGNSHGECNQVPSRENGTLVARFEKFATMWDGVNPFDVHLKLQAPMLSDGLTGDPFPLDLIYNTTAAESGWREVAKMKGVTFPAEIKRGRGYPRRLNLSKVTDATKLRICKIFIVDNCCFNLALPHVCADNDAADAFCAIERRPSGEYRIMPWNPLTADAVE